jgi:hypothetical protein
MPGWDASFIPFLANINLLTFLNEGVYLCGKQIQPVSLKTFIQIFLSSASEPQAVVK